MAGYKFSDAHIKSGIVWEEAIFTTYIKNPKEAIPGNKMAFPGIKNDKEIADLNQFGADGKKK